MNILPKHSAGTCDAFSALSSRRSVRAKSASSPSSSSNNRRRFQFVQYGDTLPANYSMMKTIACDGNVSGATVQLTHWTGNETEEKYYADTSTEIAMNFIEHNNEDDSDEYADAIVLNNHYDTDGVLSCFALLEPEFALKHKQVFIEAAESGDFGEFSSENGVKLDIALSSICDPLSSLCVTDDDELAYSLAFEKVKGVVERLNEDVGEELWKEGYDQVLEAEKVFERGNARVRRSEKDARLAIVESRTEDGYLSSQAVHKKLKEIGADGVGENPVLRVLRATKDESSGKYRYFYEKPSYGWVKKLQKRREIPDVDADVLAENLSGSSSSSWSKGGPLGLSAICQMNEYVSVSPDDMAKIVLEMERDTVFT